jgi:2'-5' RNA ligase
MPDADGTTALVVLVPEAEASWAAVRARHDPSAALGVPAHVTVLYPFVVESAWTADVDTRLADVLRASAPFDATLRRTARFGTTTLYLVPEPDAPFDALLRRVSAAFPETPPYGGAFAAPVPHLTVADGAAPGVLDALERDAAPAWAFSTRVAAVTLLALRAGRWTPRRAWPLGGG